jgi:hypothetical protein
MTPGGKPPDDTEVILSRNVSDADRLTKRPRTPVTRPPRPASNRRPRFSFFSFTCQRTERQNPSSAKDRSPRKIRRPCTPRPAETGHRTAEDRPAASSRQRKPPSSFTPRTYGSETRRPQDQMSSVEDPIRSASRSYPRPVTRTLQSPRVQRQNRPPAPRRRSAAVDGRVIGPPFRGVNTAFKKTVTRLKASWLQSVAGTRKAKWPATIRRTTAPAGRECSCRGRARPRLRCRSRTPAGNSRDLATLAPGFPRRTARPGGVAIPARR